MIDTEIERHTGWSEQEGWNDQLGHVEAHLSHCGINVATAQSPPAKFDHGLDFEGLADLGGE